MISPNKQITYNSPFTLAGLPKDAPVLLAFSGGADSSALLHLLLSDAKQNGYPLFAAHFNHKIRGEEALRDLEFCKNAAKSYGIPFFSGEADVPTLAKEHGNSIEAEAREQRYAYFARLMRENDIPILVTAHHAGDFVESVILHMLRGSGISGLCGIAPCRPFRDGRYLVRPLLETKKEDILDYCRQNGIEFVTDSTNLDTSYQRNAVRAGIVPKMRELQPELEAVVRRMSLNLRESDEFIEASAQKLLDKALSEDGICLDALNHAHPALAKRAIRSYFERFSGKMLEYTHVEAMIRLCRNAITHSQLSLPDKITAKIENERLLLSKGKIESNISDYEIRFSTGELVVPCGEIKIKIEEISFEKAEEIFKNNNKKELNILIKCGRINNACFFKNRDPSDTILVGGMHKKIKKLMCDKKVPIALRDKLPLLCCGREILWVPTVSVCDSLKKDKITNDGSYYHIKIEI